MIVRNIAVDRVSYSPVKSVEVVQPHDIGWPRIRRTRAPHHPVLLLPTHATQLEAGRTVLPHRALSVWMRPSFPIRTVRHS
jgi:hypothetical protein